MSSTRKTAVHSQQRRARTEAVSYAKLVQEDLRLCLLRVLSELPRPEVSAELLRRCLGEFGHFVSGTAAFAELKWLASAGLVVLHTTTTATMTWTSATITAQGAQAARGWLAVPGVRHKVAA